jgi:hypothetical protein
VTTDDKAEGKTTRFRSLLERGSQRFLAHVIEHGLNSGRRTYDDFIRHFPPELIMAGLKDRPSLRANILVITTGIKSKIAEKKPWDTAAQDLRIALDEGEADAETVVTLFDPDDRVRYLDPVKIWSYVIEGSFWEETRGIDYEIAKANVAFMIERALEDELITHQDIVEGVGIDVLADKLPRAELAKITRGREAKAFTDADALRETPSATLVEHIPLTHIWTKVVEPKIAKTHGYVLRKPASLMPELAAEDAAEAQQEEAQRATAAPVEEKLFPQLEARPAIESRPEAPPAPPIEASGSEKPVDKMRRIPPPIPKTKLPPTGKPEDLPS